MIYLDPPYGIKFASNFQTEIGKREVKDKETDLTREPEMVKAYRDTWSLGVHSYLAYLRDRLITARELLADTGSIFVQIGDENMHRVRCLVDEVFGPPNLVAQITFKKTGGQRSNLLAGTTDSILWYARSIERVRYHQLHLPKADGDGVAEGYGSFELPTGEVVSGTESIPAELKASARPFQGTSLTSQNPGSKYDVHLRGRTIFPKVGQWWKTDQSGMGRLQRAERLTLSGDTIRYVRYLDDYPAFPITNLWQDTGGGVGGEKTYVVQTNTKVIERCMLMTTDPGDLVLDPTCGSGTTAHVAEQWGRRWITIDTSRVAVAVARQRLLTARYEYFKLRDDDTGVAGGFWYNTVPHITLKSIAQNQNLDPVLAKHEPILDAKLAVANTSLKRISDKLRNDLRSKPALKQKQEGKKAITDADRRRWDLPKQWQHWEVPFDTDPDYPADLKKAIEEYRAAWRAKMDEVNACIAANAEQEELVDQPEVDRKITRVSGPFTVEAVQPPEMSLDDAAILDTAPAFGGAPEELEGQFVSVSMVQVGESAQNVEAYLAKMVDLLKMDGVRFPGNKHMKFTRLDPIYASGSSAGIHAEGRWVNMGEADEDPNGDATVGVVFGPQYGPITAKMIEEVIRPAARRYEDLVFAGFSFDGPAQAVIDEGHPRLRMHLAHIRPDVNPGMNGLLKEQPGSQLFTVFGRPRTKLDGPDGDGMYCLKNRAG
ncbi:MAG TPA: site-specific DNA-methyltransferase [Terriglobales bacterium]|nr:site-specific DNA-methyltransferase [Terriglobales bacterium]